MHNPIDDRKRTDDDHHEATNIEYLAAMSSKAQGDFVIPDDVDDCQHQPDVRQSTTPLHHAVSTGDIKLVENLLVNGANPNKKDGHGRTPLFYAVDNETILPLLLRHGAQVCKQLDWQAKSKVLWWAFRYLNPENDQAILMRLLYGCLEEINQKSIERQTVSVLMTWLYYRLLWIFGFVVLVVADNSGSSSDDNNKNIATMLAFFLPALALYHELIHYASYIKQGHVRPYLQDVWNWFNVTTIFLSFASVALFRWGNNLEAGIPTVQAFPGLVMTTIAFLCIAFLGDLTASFLPFSIFVGGMTQIFFDVVPFIIVTTILLLAFSLMYYIQQPPSYVDDEMKESFQNAFFFVFARFTGGFEEVDSYLDMVFGVMLVIVLFNIVIAIVTDSWQTAVNNGFINLCKHRMKLFRKVETYQAQGRIVTEKYPRLKCIFPDNPAQEYWLDRTVNDWYNPSRQNPSGANGNTIMNFVLFTAIIATLRLLAVILLFFLGLVSAGVLWPTLIRKQLLQIQMENDTTSIRVEQVAQATKTMSINVASLHVKMDSFEVKMDSVEARLEARQLEISQRLDSLDTKLDRVLARLQSTQHSSPGGPGPDVPLSER